MTTDDKAKVFDIIAKYFHFELSFETKNENGEIIEAMLSIEEKRDYDEGAWDVTAYAEIKGEDLKILRGVINDMQQ